MPGQPADVRRRRRKAGRGDRGAARLVNGFPGATGPEGRRPRRSRAASSSASSGRTAPERRRSSGSWRVSSTPTSGTVVRERDGAFGFVPQRFGLYEDLSIDENLRLRARLYGVPDDEARPPRRRPARSRGPRPVRRAARGRALGRHEAEARARRGAADAAPAAPARRADDRRRPGLAAGVLEPALNELHHEGLTIVVSTPYMDEAEYASRIGFLDEGRLSALGTRDEIVASYPRRLLVVRSSDRVARARTPRLEFPGRRRLALRKPAARPRSGGRRRRARGDGPRAALGARRARGRGRRSRRRSKTCSCSRARKATRAA